MGTLRSGRVGVIGLGLVGGSIGLACRANGYSVVGFDTSRTAALLARTLGVVDVLAPSLDRLGDVEIALIATPPDVVVPIARQLIQVGVPVVVDVAGANKAAIVAGVNHSRFVSSHPMAGSEESGCGGARADLFTGATWVIAPGPATDRDAVDQVVQLVEALGARPVEVPPVDHDELVACVIHAPHVAATALALLAGRRVDATDAIRLAGRGFRDMTRIAKGDPGLWTQLLAGNRRLAAQLRALAEIIVVLAEVIDGGDRVALHALLQAGRDAVLPSDRAAA